MFVPHYKLISYLFLLVVVGNEAAIIRTANSSYNRTLNYKHVKELLTTNFSNVLDLLEIERGANRVYDKTWKLAEARFEEIRGNLNKSNEGYQQLPDECHIALIAYTLDVAGISLYEDFTNECNKLTTEEAWKTFHYKSFFALLARSIHGVAGGQPSYEGHTVYAAVRYTTSGLKEGDYVYLSEPLPTYTKDDIALRFIGPRRGTEITFYGGSTTAIEILNYSYYPYERPMIVFPWTTYTVELFIVREQVDDLWLRASHDFIQDLPYSGKYNNEGSTVNNDL